jgi:outer membrane protein assembly factor BamB
VRFGPEGTGFNPFESTIGASNVSGLEQRWVESSGDQSFESTPVVANGLIYATSYLGRLDAFDANTGTGKWSHDMGTAYGNIAPAVAKGVVYAGSNDGLFAFEAKSGTKLWSTPTGTFGDQFSSPVVANGVVYVSSDGGKLFAFNATTGAPLWSVNAGVAFSTPAVAHGVVYIANSTELLALNATTGSELWASPAGKFGTSSSAAVANGVVYLSADKFYAYNARTGALLWSATTGGGSTWASPAIANGVVYETSSDGRLGAFNATTGVPLWSATTGTAYGAASPAVANGVVYVGGLDLYAFNATNGTRLWSSAGSSGYTVVANGMVYVDSGGIRAFGLPVPGAGLTVSPTFAPDYGTMLDGTRSSPTTFTVTNFGSSATSVLIDTFTGKDPSQFQVTSDTCARKTLAGGASCTIGVAFAPTLPGLRQATLSVSAATGGSAGATLSGTGNALTISPAAKDYGTVLDGTSSPSTTFTVTNHSSTMVSPNVASLGSSQFAVSSDSCSGATLAAGATCIIGVAFTPTGFGSISTNIESVSATLSVGSTPGVAVSANLSGTAQAVAIVPPTKDFGAVPVGSSSSATFTITNLSSAALPLPLALSVSGSGFNTTSDGCNGQSLALGASCTVVVTFAPSVTGTTYIGQLIVAVPLCGRFGCIAEALNQATLVGVGG